MPNALTDFAGPIAIFALVIALVSLGIALWRPGRRSETTDPPSASLDLATGPDLDRVLAEHRDELIRQWAALNDLRHHLDETTALTRPAVQRVGLVRFNPFEDTGSNFSFAVALLDADANGIVLSSLHSRHATRLYLKHVQSGESDIPLSEEEAEALRRAL